MAFKFEETFQVQAPIDRVWRYLADPRRIVVCLPGAAITSVESDRVFHGTVKAKVGPVTVTYTGRAELTELDESAHVVRLSAEGRESGGPGSAKLRMTSRVTARDDDSSEVRVEAEVDIAGKIMQFGRGMIDVVAKQLFRQFAECARAELEMPDTIEHVTTPPGSAPAIPANRASGAATKLGSPVHAGAEERAIRLIPFLLRAFSNAIKRLFGGGTRP